MYIVSDQVNSQGGCFAEDELDRLAELLVDSPVMVGHQRDSLPLARNFLARKVEREGRNWIKSYFYWMKDSEGAEDLMKNIDGGIYKECSISFLFTFPECSICAKDIRECEHIPFDEYEVEPGRNEIAHFRYRNIVKVLETSLVFRGALPDTGITDELWAAGDEKAGQVGGISATHFFKEANASTIGGSYRRARLSFDRADVFTPGASVNFLHFWPYQPGIVIRITGTGNGIEIESDCTLSDSVGRYLENTLSGLGDRIFTVDALLFAVRGKERLDGTGLMRILDTQDNLHRLRLRFCDALRLGDENSLGHRFSKRLGMMRAFFDASLGDNVDIRLTHTSQRKEWSADTAAADCRRYNFGVEVVAETIEGTLSRHILGHETPVPAIVTSVRCKSRAHLMCDFEVIGETTTVTDVMCSRKADLKRGSVVLLSRRLAGADRTAVWSFIDILPFGRADMILPAHAGSAPVQSQLYVTDDGDRMRLVFHQDNQWLGFVVHHFSPRLFARGRRFIADAVSRVVPVDRLSNEQIHPLRSVERCGKLLHLHPARETPIFGAFSGWWLRPILLDGVERYLFYADGPNDRPGEL